MQLISTVSHCPELYNFLMLSRQTSAVLLQNRLSRICFSDGTN